MTTSRQVNQTAVLITLGLLALAVWCIAMGYAFRLASQLPTPSPIPVCQTDTSTNCKMEG